MIENPLPWFLALAGLVLFLVENQRHIQTRKLLKISRAENEKLMVAAHLHRVAMVRQTDGGAE